MAFADRRVGAFPQSTFRSREMRSIFLNAVASALLVVAGMSPAVAAEAYYLMSVDILADDGSVTLHQQVRCPRYERCTNVLPYVLRGKKYTLYIKTNVPDDHHIYVIVGPSGLADPIQLHRDTKAFEPGNEWTAELQGLVAVAVDASKPRPKWDKATTEVRQRTVLKVRMKLED
jgi:hypothetical protein